MKITFVSPPPNLSGGVRVIAIHAERLAKRGHEVTVVAPRRARTAKAGLRDLGRNLTRGRLTAGPVTSHYDQLEAARLVLLDHAGPVTEADVPDGDIVVATWWETAFSVAAFPASKGRKVYFIQHHEVHHAGRRHIAAGSYHLPLKKITISNWLVEAMRDLYGDDDVVKVPNSVDHKLFHAPERSKQPVPTVGLLYSAKPFKGIEVSRRAIEIARKDHPELRVLTFGAAAPVARQPLPEGAEFHLSPSQDSIRDLYAQMDVWLCGSHAEGFHLPPSEAMACRCPVVSTRVGGPADIIEEGVNGFTVDPGDPEALGARLSEVLSKSPEAWKAMSDAAHQMTLDYTWDHATARFEAALLDFERSDATT